MQENCIWLPPARAGPSEVLSESSVPTTPPGRLPLPVLHTLTNSSSAVKPAGICWITDWQSLHTSNTTSRHAVEHVDGAASAHSMPASVQQTSLICEKAEFSVSMVHVECGLTGGRMTGREGPGVGGGAGGG